MEAGARALSEDGPLSPAELRALLIELLAGATETKPKVWERRLSQPMRVSLTLNPGSNWRIDFAATGDELEAAEKAVEIVRQAHPYVSW